MKVLLATNDRTFAAGFSQAYLRHGVALHAGMSSLFLRDQPFDLIHCQWPEEIVDWQLPPRQAEMEAAFECLDWWQDRTTLVATVHNLVPHAVHAADQASRALFAGFYKRMHRIGHFSEASRSAIREAFPEIPAERHFLHGMNLFEHLRPLSIGRKAARNRLGLGEGEYVVALLGQLRNAEEVALVRRGFDLAASPGLRLLFAARPSYQWYRRRNLVGRARLAHWFKRPGITRIAHRLDDAQMIAVLEAADALVIPRFGKHLNSGLLPLAMTFGTPLIAPDYGVYREMLTGSANALYTPGDARALAAAIGRMREKPGDEVRAANRAIAAGWGCDQLVERTIGAARAMKDQARD